MGWSDVTIEGKTYQYYKQDYSVECGPASAAMVAKAMGRTSDVSTMRATVRGVEAGMGSQVAEKDWTQDWTNNMGSLVHALAGRGIRNAMMNKPADNKGYTRKLRENVDAGHPAILRVHHPYGHFIVCFGKASGSGADDSAPQSFNALDPEVGPVVIHTWTPTNDHAIAYQRDGGTWYYLDNSCLITTK